MMNPLIEAKEAFRILAMSREFGFDIDDCATEIPKFRSWYAANGYGDKVRARFGVCYAFSPDGKRFRYAIAGSYDGTGPVPPGFEVLTVPAQKWAIFPCVGPADESLPKMWRYIFNEWILNDKYEKLNNFDLEEFPSGDPSARDYRMFIRIPVRRKKPGLSYSVRRDAISPDDFIHLFQSVGWTPPGREQVEVALKHSIGVFSVYANDTLIGMGRLLGDAGMSYWLKDLVILPEYQQQGAGTFLVQKILDFIGESLPKDWKASLELLSVPGKELFYKTQGFEELPNRYLSTGMIRMVEGKVESRKK